LNFVDDAMATCLASRLVARLIGKVSVVMEPDFTTRVETAEGAIVIHVTGEIDIATCERLRDVIEPHLGPEQRIVLDLSEVGFADSALLNVLVQARGRLTKDRGSLVLRNPSSAARRILAVAEMEDMLEQDALDHDDSN
jgi:anti-anti-sigma factor